MELKKELQGIIKGEVEDSQETLKEYSRDASLFEVKPRLVVFPKDTEDIKALVRFAAKHPQEKLSLTCRSGGTDMTGGPLTESIVIDVSRHMNTLLSLQAGTVLAPPGARTVPAHGGYARVQPGLFYRDFEKETAKRNLLLPSYPASKSICTVGGMVANNSGGEKTLSYGKTEDYLRQLKVVLADGNEYALKPLSSQELQGKLRQKDFEGQLYQKLFKLLEKNNELLLKAKPKVSKNSAGYYLWNVWDGKTFNLPKLLAGSQGTLGIITEIEFKLVVPEQHSTLLVIFLHDFENLAEIVQRLLRHKPESLETYDDHTLKFAVTHIPDFIKLLKGNIVTLAFQFLPEFLMFLKGGFRFPKLVVLAEFTGSSEEEIYQKANSAAEDLLEFQLQTRVARSDKEEVKFFTVRRQSFNLLRHHVRGKRTAPFIDDIIVRPSALPEFLPKLQAILNQYPKLVYTTAGHLGDGNFHIIPLMDLRKEENRKLIPGLMQKVHKLVLSFGGSITAEHNDGIIRTPFLKDMYGKEVIALFEESKKLFDPKNIFNPGKKVGGTWQFALSHIAKENKPRTATFSDYHHAPKGTVSV